MQREQLVQTPLVWDMLWFAIEREQAMWLEHMEEGEKGPGKRLAFSEAIVPGASNTQKKTTELPRHPFWLLCAGPAEFFLQGHLERTHKPGQLPARPASKAEFLETF